LENINSASREDEKFKKKEIWHRDECRITGGGRGKKDISNLHCLRKTGKRSKKREKARNETAGRRGGKGPPTRRDCQQNPLIPNPRRGKTHERNQKFDNRRRVDNKKKPGSSHEAPWNTRRRKPIPLEEGQEIENTNGGDSNEAWWEQGRDRREQSKQRSRTGYAESRQQSRS